MDGSDYFESDLTPELCLHADIDETPDGGICNTCMTILFKQEFPDKQEINNDLLPRVDDLDDLSDEETNL